MTVIDLEDCFFTILMHEQDRESFAFIVPTYNNAQPVKRYQWKVLLQEMLNTPILWHYFVQQLVEVIYRQFSQSFIHHYVDDTFFG